MGKIYTGPIDPTTTSSTSWTMGCTYGSRFKFSKDITVSSLYALVRGGHKVVPKIWNSAGVEIASGPETTSLAPTGERVWIELPLSSSIVLTGNEPYTLGMLNPTSGPLSAHMTHKTEIIRTDSSSYTMSATSGTSLFYDTSRGYPNTLGNNSYVLSIGVIYEPYLLNGLLGMMPISSIINFNNQEWLVLEQDTTKGTLLFSLKNNATITFGNYTSIENTVARFSGQINSFSASGKTLINNVEWTGGRVAPRANGSYSINWNHSPYIGKIGVLNGGQAQIYGSKIYPAHLSNFYQIFSPSIYDNETNKTYIRHETDYSSGFGVYDGNSPVNVHIAVYVNPLADVVNSVIVTNSIPTLTDNTPNNKVFYEQDTITINGSVKDTDNGDIISVKYKVNNGTIRAIATGISDGTTPLAYSKSLKYTDNKLFDGLTEVASGLVDGQTYDITIFAEDDKGGKSTNVVRNFTVVPNRPPVLTVEPFSNKTNQINSEVIVLNGNVTDADNNNVTVTIKINNQASKQIHSGAPSGFTTNIKIGDLIEGENILVVTAKDTFDFTVSKTLKLNKVKNATKLKNAIARYKINPPSGSAKQVLAWIQREVGDLVVDADISMVMGLENEVYTPMAKLTAPIDDLIAEDEFTHETLENKDNITLKLKMTKVDENSTKSIKQISGVLK